MAKPIFVLAGQSNAVRMTEEITATLNRTYGLNGYILVEAAVGSTTLTWAQDNRLDWATASEMPERLVNAIKQAVQRNPDAEVGGMIWVQGEGDSATDGNPDSYGEALKALIDRVQREVPEIGTASAQSFAELPVVISQLAQAPKINYDRPGWDTVVFEQASLAASSDMFGIVDPDEVGRKLGLSRWTMFEDWVHYDPDFQQALADRLVAQLIELNSDTGTPGDRILGAGVAEALTGGDGNDIIKGLGGEDILSGANGHDTIFGGRANDRINGGDGDDVLWGYRGRDILSGGAGDDHFYAGHGHDIARGGAGDDYMKGCNGNDRLHGGQGSDIMLGGSWRDQLFGGADDDFLFGGNGRDTLSGGEGNDVLTGGGTHYRGDRQQDIFSFEDTPSVATEYDRIKDFEPGIDRLDVSSFDFVSTDAFFNITIQRSAGVEVRLSSDHAVLLEDITLAQLSSVDLIL